MRLDDPRRTEFGFVDRPMYQNLPLRVALKSITYRPHVVAQCGQPGEPGVHGSNPSVSAAD